jgi:transposase
VAHSLALGLFSSGLQAAAATRALHADGLRREAISVVARSHAEASALAREFDATPGVEIEDSRAAARVGEIGAAVIAAAAVFLPGVGPIVMAGPLGAELGEAAGHLAGGLATILTRAGVDAAQASAWQNAVADGHVLVGVHVAPADAQAVAELLRTHGADSVELARWEGDLP